MQPVPGISILNNKYEHQKVVFNRYCWWALFIPDHGDQSLEDFRPWYEEAILYADLSPAAEHSVPGGKGFPNTMKKDNTIRDMGDHAFAGKVVGFIAARNDALFGKLLDEAAGLLVMR